MRTTDPGRIVAALACLSIGVASAQYGLDNTYAGAGMVLTDMADSTDAIHGTVTQPDGKLVAVGWVQDTAGVHMGIARFEVNGALDTSFSGDGRVVTDFVAVDHSAEAADVQADGKILVAGAIVGGDTSYMTLVRMLANGTLDSTFGTDGVVAREWGTANAFFNNVVALDDGRILALGRVDPALNHIVLYRFLPDGSTDSTFGTSGWIDVYDFYGARYAQMAVQPDGAIVMEMTWTDLPLNDLMVMRFLPDGGVDSSFAVNGTFLYDAADTEIGRDIALQSDGAIIVAWDVQNALGNSETRVLRLLTDGTLDASFGVSGVTTLAVAGSEMYTWEIRIDPSDRIVGAGRFYGPQAEFFAYRLLADGPIDPSFTATGIYVHDFTPGFGEAYTLELGPAGRVIMAGIYLPDFSSGAEDFALVAIRNNPVQGIDDPALGDVALVHDPSAQEIISVDGGLDIGSLQVCDAQGRYHLLPASGVGRWSTRSLAAGAYVVRASTSPSLAPLRFVKW